MRDGTVIGTAAPTEHRHMGHMLSVIADGGIILSKAVEDKNVLPRQIMLYRDFVRNLFQGN